MTNATTSNNPAATPYAVIVLTGGFTVERFAYPEPLDALIAAVRYLREGRQVRLSDRTCSAMHEVPSLGLLDRLIAELAPQAAPIDLGPAIALFRAPDRG